MANLSKAVYRFNAILIKIQYNSSKTWKEHFSNSLAQRQGRQVGNFLNTTTMAQVLRPRIDKWDLMKLKRYCTAKDIEQIGNLQIGKKIFSNPISNRGLISEIYKELKKLTSKKPKQLNQKLGIKLNQEFTTEGSEIAEKHLKKCSKSLVIREMQIRTTLRFHLTPVKMAKIKNSGNSTCWQGCGERGTLLHCWWDCKLVQPVWKSIWRFLRKLETDLPEDPAISLLSFTQKMPHHVIGTHVPLCL